jgi:hypothetical protein
MTSLDLTHGISIVIGQETEKGDLVSIKLVSFIAGKNGEQFRCVVGHPRRLSCVTIFLLLGFDWIRIGSHEASDQ